jgi:hypothetical protein
MPFNNTSTVEVTGDILGGSPPWVTIFNSGGLPPWGNANLTAPGRFEWQVIAMNPPWVIQGGSSGGEGPFAANPFLGWTSPGWYEIQVQAVLGTGTFDVTVVVNGW